MTPFDTNFTSGSIPTEHQLLEKPKVRDFGDWMDEQLSFLEAQFSSSVTSQSLKGSLGR